VPGRSLVVLPEEPAGAMSVPVDEALLVDPSADPEEEVISGVAGSVAGVLPVSEPPVVVTTGVGVGDREPSGPSAWTARRGMLSRIKNIPATSRRVSHDESHLPRRD